MVKALEQLAGYIDAEGPFDGVMGFSQGATLAATYLIQRSQQHPNERLPFRCAIFLSGPRPYDPPALAPGEVRYFELEATGRSVINLPTAHIWGRRDVRCAHDCEALLELCDAAQRDAYVHAGEHEIPGARAPEDIQGCIRTVRRIIDKAQMDF
jgi:predicted esterase